MDAQLYLGKIYIIEWLGPQDVIKTGWELFNELQPMGLMSAPQIEVSFKRVKDKAEFIAHIRAIADDFRVTRKLPLLHIESHGFDDGLGPTQDDQILWPELMDELIVLNQLTQLRLWIVVAACEGLWGLKMAQPSTRAAFLALLGPNKPIETGDLLTALRIFYTDIFKDRNGNTAIKAMNDAIKPKGVAFGIMNAEKLFLDVYRAFIKGCTEDELSARVERIVAMNIAKFKAARGVGMWKHEVAETRRMARDLVGALDEQFDHYRNQFFFIDLYPDNNHRFPITLDDCRKAAG